MITVDDAALEYSNMGLFDSETPWLHPITTVNTYELLLVTSGEVHLREGQNEYHLKKGDLLLLDKNVEHGASQISRGYTAFYWLHFFCDDIQKWNVPKQIATDFPLAERALKEIMHLQNRSKTLAELTLAKFLFTLSEHSEPKNKYAYEIAEFIRIHRDAPLSVQTVAQRFGYTPDHLARLLKKEFGKDTQTLIVERRLEYVESLLINTDYSIREIAETTGFKNENCFIKFFKYHTKTTPTAFRHRFFDIHMNNK